MPRFIFFYIMTDDATRIREAVPAQVAYWRDSGVDAYEGGPFSDRSGGLITFAARDLAEATEVSNTDPSAVAGLIRDRWVKESLA